MRDIAIPYLPADRQGDKAYLDGLATRLAIEAQTVAGYPIQVGVEQHHLSAWLDVMPNNLGDPESADSNDLHTKRLELAVIEYLARLMGCDPGSVYGYIAPTTSNALLWALYTARTHTRKDDQTRRVPVYVSEEVHFGVLQVLDILEMPYSVIPTGPDHGMDSAALHAACVAAAGQGAIVVATVGTTMWGGVDNVPELRDAARPAGDVLVICDGALGGWVAAALGVPVGPVAGADIVVLSAHKMIIPETAGLILATREVVTSTSTARYVGAESATLGCSRSGVLAVRVWDALRALGHAGLLLRVRACVDTAQWAVRELERLGWDPWRHPISTTVVIARPPAAVCHRWHLATDGDHAHIVVGPHLSRERVARILADLGSRAEGGARPPLPVRPLRVRLVPVAWLRTGIPYAWTSTVGGVAYGAFYELPPAKGAVRVVILADGKLTTVGRCTTPGEVQQLIERHRFGARVAIPHQRRPVEE